MAASPCLKRSCCLEVRFYLSILPFRSLPRVEIHSTLLFLLWKSNWQSRKILLCCLVVRRAMRIRNPRVVRFVYGRICMAMSLYWMYALRGLEVLVSAGSFIVAFGEPSPYAQ